jgi:aspartyl protease family protein
VSDNAPYIVFYSAAIVFVASALLGRRLPLGKTMKMVAAWIAIFAVFFVLFAFRSELSGIGERLRAEATGNPIVQGKEVRIPISDDGHFWVDAKLNDHDVRFMVDSGASITTVSSDEAKAAGMTIGTEKAVVSTANGPTLVTKGWASRLQVGTIDKRDFSVDISDQEGVNLLGMNFLSSLRSWRVDGNYLVLVP